MLPCAHMRHIVVPAWKDVVVERSTPSFEPSSHRLSCRLHKLELNRPLGLLLHHDGAVADAPARHEVADPDLDAIAAAQLAVDREVEKCSVS